MAKLAKDLEKGAIGANQAIDLILQGMKEFDGMMDATANETVEGLKSQIEDTFEINIFRKWGQGLQDGAKKGLGAVVEALNLSEGELSRFGDTLQDLGMKLSNWLADRAINAVERFKKVLNTDEFKNAEGFEKIKIIWDKVIAEPFSEWWDTKGKKVVADKFQQFGEGIGKGITNGLLGLLGFDAVGATADGISIAGAFSKGFAEGIDGDAIAKALANALKNAFKDALKVLPGGDSATGTSWLNAGILSFLGLKMGGGKLLGKGASKLFGKLNGPQFVDDVAYMAWLKKNANPKTGGGLFSKIGDKLGKFKGIFGATDDIASGASKLGKLGSIGGKLGKFAKGNWLSLLFAGGAIASADDKTREVAKQGLGLAGSAGGGALGAKVGATIGSFIMPGAGTAVGGAIGGFVGSTAGYLAGEKGGGKLWDSVKGWDGWSSLKEGWNGFIDGAKSFFTKTIPEKWNGFIDGAKTFFTETIPEKWNEFIDGAETFFTETLPESVSTFFTETLPYKFGELVGKAEVFFTETLPEWWNNSVEAVGTFFTETLPEWWSEKMEAIGVFFTETLPEWWSEKVDAVGTFFTETLPEWWSEKVEAVGTFFTETLPGWWETTVNDFISYWTVDVPAYWNSKVDEIASGWDDVKNYFKEKADAIGAWFSEKTEGIKTKYEEAKGWFGDKWETVKSKFEQGRADAKHATGGIFSKPHVGLVAEDGPEAIIPLGGKRRQRGLDLWRKAGMALGVTPYANGGIVGNPQNIAGGIQIGNITVQINVDGGNGTLLEALNSQSEEIKEAITGILLSALHNSFENMPVTT